MFWPFVFFVFSAALMMVFGLFIHQIYQPCENEKKRFHTFCKRLNLNFMHEICSRKRQCSIYVKAFLLGCSMNVHT